ncbi:21656_t:CDS:2 [Gigaspora margarita]|uniref:21656_t:CDS:1 n=1 Tax=Gigaspora margarita TaxID=4874 RepID=A0ABN7VUG5_GIGMA|nr:21656_t:CDS:2 [Gigaspora margarita]
MDLSDEALEEAVQAATKTQGFAFSRHNSNLEGHNRKFYSIQKVKNSIIIEILHLNHVKEIQKLNNVAALFIYEPLPSENALKLEYELEKLLYKLHTVGTPIHIITTAINQFSNSGIVVPKDAANK